MMRIARHSVAFFAAASLLVGCDNRPTASRGDLPLYAEFHAYHLEDERGATRIVIDTVYVYFYGSGVGSGMSVVLNGSLLPLAAMVGSEALYADCVAVDPGTTFRLGVSNGWQSAQNDIVAPSGRPHIVTPAADSICARDQDILVRWTGADTGMVDMELAVGGATGSLGSTLWTASLPASDGIAVVPSSVWEGLSDTTAVLNLWQVGTKVGEGFAGGLTMFAGAGVRSLVRVSSPGTTSRLARLRRGDDWVGAPPHPRREQARYPRHLDN